MYIRSLFFAAGFSYTQGINESIMGALMGAGALFGILGTIVYPRMRKCVGLQKTGLFGLSFQISFLTLCVASVWSPGSPFDINYRNNKDGDDVRADANATELPPLFNTTTPPPLFNTTTPGPSDPGTSDDSWEDYISVGLLMTGIIGARFGKIFFHFHDRLFLLIIYESSLKVSPNSSEPDKFYF